MIQSFRDRWESIDDCRVAILGSSEGADTLRLFLGESCGELCLLAHFLVATNT